MRTSNTSLNDSSMADPKVMKGKTLDERVSIMYEKLKDVDTIPEVLNGDDALLFTCSEPSPGPILQELISEGRSYTQSSTSNQEIVSLFPDSKKVIAVGFNCKR